MRLLAFIANSARNGTSESSKRVVALCATFTLCFVGVCLGGGILWQVLAHRAVDGNLVAALGTVTVPLAGLAGAIGRKKDDPVTPA